MSANPFSFLYYQLIYEYPLPTKSFEGKTVIVTGANIGLGFEASKHIARLNASKLILGVRSVDKGETAKKAIEATLPSDSKTAIEVWPIDMSDHDSIKHFADRANKLDRLDAVLENAGIVADKFVKLGEDESTIAVNVTGTFLLALLVLPTLRRSAKTHGAQGNLSIVSSAVHAFTKIPERKAKEGIFNALNDPAKANMIDRYNVSKLLEVFGVRTLASQSPFSKDSPVVINNLHPGMAKSNIFHGTGGWYQKVATFIMNLLGKSTEEGSRTLVWAISSDESSHGQYMSETKVKPVASFVTSKDGIATQNKFWDELVVKLEKISPEMPSEDSTWLIAVPDNGDAEALLPDIEDKIRSQLRSTSGGIARLSIPSLKTGTLDSLITLSEEIPKLDSFFTGTVAKTVETLRNLLNNDPSKLAQHTLVNEQTVDDYLLKGWKWNEGRYGAQRSLRDIIDALNKEMTSIDNSMKAKLNNYNVVKGSLTQMQRKKLGNLSVRSLADIVRKDQVITDSDYLETLLVAVPKNSVKEWNNSYEKLTSMIVPRSSQLVDKDDDYSLFAVTAFKRVHDEFVQKCRERKFIVRDFVYSEEAIEKQRQELATTDITEKELWTELLRLSRTNFSESFQILVHLKITRLFVESVLQYGLPANYTGLIIKPDSKTTQKTFSLLSSQFSYLRRTHGDKSKKKDKGDTDDFAGEYQTLIDQETFDFVLYEIPWIIE